MISNKKNTLWNRLRRFCLNLLEKVLLCIFIAVMALIVILSAMPPLLIYLLIGNKSIHSLKKISVEQSLSQGYNLSAGQEIQIPAEEEW